MDNRLSTFLNSYFNYCSFVSIELSILEKTIHRNEACLYEAIYRLTDISVLFFTFGNEIRHLCIKDFKPIFNCINWTLIIMSIQSAIYKLEIQARCSIKGEWIKALNAIFEAHVFKEKSPEKPVSVPCLLSYVFPGSCMYTQHEDINNIYPTIPQTVSPWKPLAKPGR